MVLPSYNGARKLPNLTPLLALLLAQEGAQVLVHGPMLDPGRVSTAEIFRDLETWLAEVTGFAGVSLQPNAGSQGEYAGLLVIAAVLLVWGLVR